jgi:hypothetical protein
VLGMETVYREMEGMRKALPQNETGEMMRKVCISRPAVLFVWQWCHWRRRRWIVSLLT